MTETAVRWVVIAAAGLGTYAFRAAFLALAARIGEVPPRWRRPLRMIAPAVLAALVAPALLRPEGHLDLFQPRLVAGLIAAAVAWRSRSIGLTIAVGLVALLLLERTPLA